MRFTSVIVLTALMSAAVVAADQLRQRLEGPGEGQPTAGQRNGPSGPQSARPSAPSPQDRPMTVEEMHKLHQNSAAYIAMLEDPARDAYQKPREVVTALGLKAGERIADIGAGAGYFSLRFANHVGDRGLVYAVDISPEKDAKTGHELERLDGAAGGRGCGRERFLRTQGLAGT